MSIINDKISLLPNQPGCYLMKNKEQAIIYVGKAKNLRNRVRSYFSGSHDAKTQRLVMEITDFEYIVTHSDLEALILECNLIKKYHPRFNVLLKDDKSYPYIRLTREEHPRLEITRNIQRDGSKYYGPYPDVGAAQQTKKLLDKLYPLRKCRQLPKRVCLYYHLDQCLAPCEFPVSQIQYNQITREIERFLSGGYTEVQKQLGKQMLEASEALQFERAKELRDIIQSIEQVMQKQNIVFHDHMDRDVFGYYAEKGWMCVQVFFVRQGKVLERDVSIFPHFHDPVEELHSYIAQFYSDAPELPREIFFPTEIDQELLGDLLTPRRVHCPQRGLKKKLVDMARDNAKIALREMFQLKEKDHKHTVQAAQQLGKQLQIRQLDRIEAFDNSNIQGTDPVSAMVVFEHGKPAKKEYRKYKIRTVDKPDDVETMREVIRRRYTRVLKEGLPLPNLILVDGGKAQCSAAIDILENELGLFIPVAGMVKNQKHQTAGLVYGDPPRDVDLARGTEAFYLVQRIQEEVHRFAISFHHKTREKSAFRSKLDTIPGVGKKRKQRLFQHFGSIDQMKKASVEDYRQIGIGEKLAQTILDHLNQ